MMITTRGDFFEGKDHLEVVCCRLTYLLSKRDHLEGNVKHLLNMLKVCLYCKLCVHICMCLKVEVD